MVKYGRGEDLSKYKLYSQYLISDRLKFKNIDGKLAYLSGREFSLEDGKYYHELEKVF